MKKSILFPILLLSVIVHAQQIVPLYDANSGYLWPDSLRCCPYGLTWDVPNYYVESDLRDGNNFPQQPQGTKIYGIACLLCSNIPDSVEIYAFLFMDTLGCVAVDSVRVDTIVPTSYLMFDCPDGDTLIPMYEVFFDRGYYIDGSRFSVAIGHKDIESEEEIQKHHTITMYHRRCSFYSLIGGDTKDFYYRRNGNCDIIPASVEFSGAIPIIDSTLRIRHEQTASCGDIGRLHAEYTDVRVNSLHWTDTVGHCLYQVAYGLANQPVSGYTVVETTDTSYTLLGLSYAVPYAYRVRAKCCLDDTFSVWLPWSDTLRFERPYYRVTALANNPYWGDVTGGGLHEQDWEVTVQAFPAESCTFEHWDDGDTSNPRTITLVSDTTLTAIFEYHDTTGGGTPVAVSPERDDVTVVPNPTDGRVTVASSFKIVEVEIFSADGRLVECRKGDGIGLTMDVSEYAKGTYIARIRTVAGVATKRLVVY